MISTPALTVLMPFRNAAKTLEETLDSIQRQSFRHFELVAVNDASCDASVAIMSQRSHGDRRIRMLHNPGHGLVSALNFGLSQARGNLIARMDADDLMHPERLRLQYEFLQQNPDISLLGSRVKLISDTPIASGYREYIRWQNSCLSPQEIAENIYIESPLAHPSVLFRRQAVTALGGYREGPFPEDYDLWLRMHQAGYRMAKLPETLLTWRERPERVSRTDPRCSREAFDRLRARYLATEPRLLRRRDHFVIWGAGRKTRKRCRHLLARGFRPQAWIDIDPRKIGNRLQGVPVVAPDWLAQHPRPFVLCYVTNHGARDRIAEDLHALGYRRGQDYLMVG